MEFDFYWARKLLKNRRKNIGNLILIILVTIPLVCSLVFVDSMIEGITNKYICLSGGNIRFEALGDSEINSENLDRTVLGYAVVYSSDQNTNVMIKGVDESYFNSRRISQITILDSAEETKPNSMMVSQNLAENLGLAVGDKFALMVLSNPNDSTSTFSSVIRPVLVQVGSIYSSGYSQLDENLIFGSFDYIEGILNSSTIYYEMLTQVNDPQENLEIARSMMNGNSQLLNYSLWNQLNTSIYENFVNSRQMVLIIVFVIGFIACFYTGSIAHEMVQDNFHDICIMRLLGARERVVHRTLFISTLSISFIGLIVGVFLGLLVSFNLTPFFRFLASSGYSAFAMYLLDFPVEVNSGELVIMFLLLFFASALSIFFSLKNEKNLSPLQLLQS